jgi:pyruvate formate lyase activating enzyme
LFDLKEMDSERHRRFTGVSNDGLLRNLLRLGERMRDGNIGAKLWIRTPLIPGATARSENLSAMGRWLAEHLDDIVERWELCAFNNLCRSKYERLGLSWKYGDTPLLTKPELADLEQQAMASGVQPSIVIATGMTRSS